jgi:uncharacterized repeat protein (TIGR03803 family)
MPSLRRHALLMMGLWVLPSGAALAAASESVLLTFAGTNGQYPFGGLVGDAKGNLYGMTSAGTSNKGIVFELSPPASGAGAWTQTTLLTFTGSNGDDPQSTLMIDSKGNLYGTTYYGGSAFSAAANIPGTGIAFELSPPATGKTAWTETILTNFTGTNGAYPLAGLVAGSNGHLYGTTLEGGASNDGTLFELTPPATGQTAWTTTTLIAFSGTNGYHPIGGLVLDSAGNLYGTTENGGTLGDGNLFELSPPATGTAWTEDVLLAFNGTTDGSLPRASLIMDSAGNLYGTTKNGGKDGYGCVFRLTKPTESGASWVEKVLASFTGTNGSGAYGALAFDSAGDLLGLTESGGKDGDGTIFKIAVPATGATAWKESTLITFDGTNGATGYGGLIADTSGNFYGMTEFGGADNDGVVFKLVP